MLVQELIDKMYQYYEPIKDDDDCAEKMRKEFASQYRETWKIIYSMPFEINMMPMTDVEMARLAYFKESMDIGEKLEEHYMKLAEFYTANP
jgi:hypothetical protein